MYYLIQETRLHHSSTLIKKVRIPNIARHFGDTFSFLLLLVISHLIVKMKRYLQRVRYWLLISQNSSKDMYNSTLTINSVIIVKLCGIAFNVKASLLSVSPVVAAAGWLVEAQTLLCGGAVGFLTLSNSERCSFGWFAAAHMQDLQSQS